MTVSNEAVEAALKALGRHYGGRYSDEMVATVREEIRVALEAAAPLIQAQALEEVAADIGRPRVLWWGDEGAMVAESPDSPNGFTKLTDWLRARAAALRGQG